MIETPFLWSSLLALALTSGLTAQDSSPKVDWLTDLGAAEKAAEESGKPLLLVFR